MSPELQIIFVFGVFLGLLAAGMAMPFAIVVPAMLYLLLQGGLAALKGIGLVSWGSMNSFTLTAIPLFILMAEILQASGLSCASIAACRKLVAQCRAACCRPTSPAARCSPRSAAPASRPPPRSAGSRCRNSSSAATTAAGRGLAGRRRHARHPDPARHRDDRLRHLHRDLGGQAVHGGRRAGPAADRDVHGLYRGARG